MKEAQTKYDYIEPTLSEAVQGSIEGSRVIKEYLVTQGRLIGQGHRSKPLSANYVLQYKGRNRETAKLRK